MLTFCLCLVLNAHPDAWLSEPAFSEKYLLQQVAIIRKMENVEDNLRKLAVESPDRAAQILLYVGRINNQRELLVKGQAAKRLSRLLNYDD